MISSTGEYALRAAVLLAQRHPEPQTNATIAEATQVPVGYLAKVLQALVRAGLVSSRRGLYGGFALRRAPSRISVLQVLAATRCAPQRIRRCPLGIAGHVSLCPVHSLVDQAMASATAVLEGVTVADLVGAAGGSIPLCSHDANSSARKP